MKKLRRTYCIADDRTVNEEALRVVISSLFSKSSEIVLNLFISNQSSIFETWLQKFPKIIVRPLKDYTRSDKYNIKPQLLLLLVDEGYDEVIWLDSDLIIYKPLWFEKSLVDETSIVVAEEALCHNYFDNGACRARGWGLAVGRILPFNINTAVLRVTPRHRELIICWMNLLATDEYNAAQNMPWKDRPPHLYGDQDVLTAVLSCTRFAHIGIIYLRRGKDIIQYFGPYGYTVRERLYHVFIGRPFIIHAQGHRPWILAAFPKLGSRYEKWMYIYNDCSPYRIVAGQYNKEITDESWLYPKTRVGKALQFLSFNSFPLVGIPIAIVADLKRVIFGIRNPNN